MISEVRALIYVGMFGDAGVADMAVADLAHVCASQPWVQRWTLDKHCQRVDMEERTLCHGSDVEEITWMHCIADLPPPPSH